MLELVKQRESERAGSNGGLSVERTGDVAASNLQKKIGKQQFKIGTLARQTRSRF
jgi:hypothetical protein